VFAVIISAVIFSDLRDFVLIGLAAAIANSVLDFGLTWGYYFPNLEKIYREQRN
jgi:hypothetical protein